MTPITIETKMTDTVKVPVRPVTLSKPVSVGIISRDDLRLFMLSKYCPYGVLDEKQVTFKWIPDAYITEDHFRQLEGCDILILAWQWPRYELKYERWLQKFPVVICPVGEGNLGAMFPSIQDHVLAVGGVIDGEWWGESNMTSNIDMVDEAKVHFVKESGAICEAIGTAVAASIACGKVAFYYDKFRQQWKANGSSEELKQLFSYSKIEDNFDRVGFGVLQIEKEKENNWPLILALTFFLFVLFLFLKKVVGII